MCGVHPSYDSSSVSLSFGPGKFDLQASSPVRITKLFKLPKTWLNHEDLFSSLDSIGINWIQSYRCDSIKTCESEKNRWRIFMAEGGLPAHLSTKTTMIMRRCPSEVLVEASDMGNPEFFAHWVLLIKSCFSTHGNEFQIKLKVMKPRWN